MPIGKGKTLRRAALSGLLLLTGCLAQAPTDPVALWVASIPRGTGPSGDDWTPIAPPPGAPIPYERFSIRMDSPVRHTDASDRIAGEYFRPASAWGAVVVLPGYRSGFSVERALCDRLAQEGLAAFLLHLPYQQSRAVPGIETDAWTISSDLDRNERVLHQALADIRRVRLWLGEETGLPPSRTGLFGLSLGGYVAATAYSIDRDWPCAVLAYCGGNVSDILWADHWLNQMAGWKEGLVRQGHTLESVRERCLRVDPLTHAEPSRPAGVLLFASDIDEIVPEANARALAAALGGAPTIWTGGGHAQACLALPLQHDRIVSHFRDTLAPR